MTTGSGPKRNGKTLTRLKDAYHAGQAAALRGQSITSVFYKSALMVAAWTRGFESAKRTKEKSNGKK